MLAKLHPTVALAALALLLSACSNGGNLTLEPGAVVTKKKGSPFVQVNQGGKARIESASGVTAWVAVQAVASKNLSDGSGHKIIMNKTSAVNNQ